MKTIYFLSALCLLVGTNSQAQIQASDSAQIAEVFLVRGPVRPDRGGERNRGPGLDDRRRSGDDRRRESIRERHPSRNDRSGWRGGGSRPGWSEAWRWRHDHRPQWWHERAVFPLFLWAAQSPRGSWQCTAFDQNQIPYTSAASTQDAAAYNALYDCGGRNYEDECYIPEGYCQYRY